MRINEIEERLSAIKAEMDTDGADIKALSDEADALLEERATLLKQIETRKATLEKIANAGAGEGEKIAMEKQARVYTAADAEYRTAFLKNLLDLEMNKQERAAFAHTTANTTAPLPTTMLNQIWDLVYGEHAILGDVSIYRTGTTLEVIKHTEIKAGKAKKVNENAANDDEQNTFVKVVLSGNDYSKHVDISYAMGKMSIEGLEAYLVSEIAKGLGEAMTEGLIEKIIAGINAANKVTSAANTGFTYGEIVKAFGLLKRVSGVTLYATRATIYNHLVGLTDTTGRPIFQPSINAAAEGSLLGATIKVEDAVADGTILIGDPKKVTYNMVQDIMIESTRDIKKHVITYSGYARGEGELIDDKAFAHLVLKAV
nr:phage major capsid protein [uncultured Anaerotignum sp.]